MTTTLSPHVTSLTGGEVVEQNDLGSITKVTADTFPILSGMSIKRIVLNPGAMRTPHWHANANELTYCVSGTSFVSVLDIYSKFSSFTVSAGEMFHIDSGSLHHIENIGDEPAEFILAFRSERPEDFGLAASFGAMTDAVLGNTYDLPASDFAKIRRDTNDRRLAARKADDVVPIRSSSPATTPSTDATWSRRRRVDFHPGTIRTRRARCRTARVTLSARRYIQ